jgi:hypothetical protein
MVETTRIDCIHNAERFYHHSAFLKQSSDFTENKRNSDTDMDVFTLVCWTCQRESVKPFLVQLSSCSIKIGPLHNGGSCVT